MKLLVALGLLALGNTAAAADDYSPGPNVPDYFASITEQTSDRSDAQFEIYHHGEWTRTDRSGGSLYTKAGGGVDVRLLGSENGATPYYVTVTNYLRKAKGFTIPLDNPTGETDTILGEKCYRWWLRDRPPPSRKTWSHCLTSDGIELAAQIVFAKSGGEELFQRSWATVLERRVIAPKDVQPAASHLDLRRHLDVPAVAERSDQADFVVTLQTAGGVSTVKRRYPWFNWDTRKPDGSRQLHVWNQLTGQGAEITLEPNQRNHMSFTLGFSVDGFSKIEGAEGRLPLGLVVTGLDQDKSEIVLGVKCNWFDTTPGDKYRTSEICFSKDGVPLRIKQSKYGHNHKTFTATSLGYRDITADEMLPEAGLLKPADWGFPK